jgi:hypothetical protein
MLNDLGSLLNGRIEHLQGICSGHKVLPAAIDLVHQADICDVEKVVQFLLGIKWISP